MLVPLQTVANNICVGTRSKAPKTADFMPAAINVHNKQLLPVPYMHAAAVKLVPCPSNPHKHNPLITKLYNTLTILNKQAITNPRGLCHVFVSIKLVGECL